MAESRTGLKFGHPTLFLFLVYFSFTSPFLLDLHDAFTTCSMTNTTVTSDTCRCTFHPFRFGEGWHVSFRHGFQNSVGDIAEA